jgi:hypothetical protein
MKTPLQPRVALSAKIANARARFEQILASGDRSEFRATFGRVIRAAERGGASEDDLVFVRTSLGYAVWEVPRAKELREKRERMNVPLLRHNDRRKHSEELVQRISKLDISLREKYPRNQHRYNVIRARLKPLKTKLTVRQIGYICTGK